jgi:hypothetical protein
MPKITSEDHAKAEDAFTDGKSTKQVQDLLQEGKDGLTKAQANSACRTARKHLGIYKKGSGKSHASDADKQAEMKTEIDDKL